jgi:hypothetical protein
MLRLRGGERPERLFSEAAAYFLVKSQEKASIVSETYHLKSVPCRPSANLPIDHVRDGTWRPMSEGARPPAVPTRP